jgi:hypothetical protein
MRHLREKRAKNREGTRLRGLQTKWAAAAAAHHIATPTGDAHRPIYDPEAAVGKPIRGASVR